MSTLAIDTETTGLDSYHGAQPYQVLLHDGEVSTEIKFDVDPLTRKVDIDVQKIKVLQRRLDKAQKIIFHNSIFDVRMLESIGLKLDWKKIHDTMISAHLLNSSLPKNLTYQAARYLEVDLDPLEKEIKRYALKARLKARKEFPEWRIAQKGLSEMPSAKGKLWKSDCWLFWLLEMDEAIEAMREYAFGDVEATYYLHQAHLMRLDDDHKTIYDYRLTLLPVTYDLERDGIALNTKRLDTLTAEFKQQSEKSKNLCEKIAKSFSVNLQLPKSGNSHALTDFVFNTMGLEPKEVSKKTGNPTLNKGVLSSYALELKPKSKQGLFIRSLLNKRKRDTALTYISGYTDFMLPIDTDENVSDWYRLHPRLSSVGTKTLRWSSQNPNEQNISKQEGFNLRYAFGPMPDREWWALDYNNLELRIPAYECEEPAMLELFEKPNDPPFYGSYHLLIFSLLYPDIFKKYGSKVKDKYKSSLYQWTKNGNFAELYGAVDTKDGNSTADKAFRFPGAQALVASKLKRKAALNKSWIAYANRNGFVRTIPDKTRGHIGYPLYCPKTYGNRISPTIPLNYHVQGTACQAINSAMQRCYQYLLENPSIQGKMVMQVHDEIVFELPYVPDKGNKSIIDKLVSIMVKSGTDIGVPLTVGVDYHPNNWSESM